MHFVSIVVNPEKGMADFSQVYKKIKRIYSLSSKSYKGEIGFDFYRNEIRLFCTDEKKLLSLLVEPGIQSLLKTDLILNRKLTAYQAPHSGLYVSWHRSREEDRALKNKNQPRKKSGNLFLDLTSTSNGQRFNLWLKPEFTTNLPDLTRNPKTTTYGLSNRDNGVFWMPRFDLNMEVYL